MKIKEKHGKAYKTEEPIIDRTITLEPGDDIYIIYKPRGEIFTIKLTQDHIDKKEPLFINKNGDKRQKRHIVYLINHILSERDYILDTLDPTSHDYCYKKCHYVIGNPYLDFYAKNISYQLSTSYETILNYSKYVTTYML